MTGQFTEIDPIRCAHYARFFKNLTVTEANLIFWLLFSLVLVLMCTASIIHHKSIALSEAAKKLPAHIRSSEEHIISLRRQRVKSLSLVSLCACISATCLILECFAAFNIEYCDGEDLMMLYWGFWSILQVGSNIAILGVMLQFWIILGDVETPSWAVALGTPVLVFAALGFVLKEIWTKVWSRCTGRKNSPEPDSIKPTITIEEEEKAIDTPPQIRPSVIVPRSTAPALNRSRATRASTSFWSRDVHYLMSSILNENPNPPIPHSYIDQNGNLMVITENPRFGVVEGRDRH